MHRARRGAFESSSMKHVSPTEVNRDLRAKPPTRRALAKQQTRGKVLAAARTLAPQLISEQLNAAVERGELRQEAEVKLRAQMLHDAYLNNFHPAIFEGWTLDALQARSREQIRILLSGTR